MVLMVRDLPLLERKARLPHVIADVPRVQLRSGQIHRTAPGASPHGSKSRIRTMLAARHSGFARDETVLISHSAYLRGALVLTSSNV